MLTADAMLREWRKCREVRDAGAKRIAELEAQLAEALEHGQAADMAIQAISLALGGPDEWTDFQTMCTSTKTLAEEMVRAQ